MIDWISKLGFDYKRNGQSTPSFVPVCVNRYASCLSLITIARLAFASQQLLGLDNAWSSALLHHSKADYDE